MSFPHIPTQEEGPSMHRRIIPAAVLALALAAPGIATAGNHKEHQCPNTPTQPPTSPPSEPPTTPPQVAPPTPTPPAPSPPSQPAPPAPPTSPPSTPPVTPPCNCASICTSRRIITIRIVEKAPLSSAYVEYNGVKTKAKRGKDGRLRVTFGFAGRQYVRGQKQTESIAIIGKRRGGSTVAGTRRYRPCEMKLGHLNGAPFRL